MLLQVSADAAKRHLQVMRYVCLGQGALLVCTVVTQRRYTCAQYNLDVYTCGLLAHVGLCRHVCGCIAWTCGCKWVHWHTRQVSMVRLHTQSLWQFSVDTQGYQQILHVSL